jgi:hypothetical protein
MKKELENKELETKNEESALVIMETMQNDIKSYESTAISGQDYIANLLSTETIDITQEYWGFESVIKSGEWKIDVVVKTEAALRKMAERGETNTDEWQEKGLFLRKFKRKLRYVKTEQGAALGLDMKPIINSATGEVELKDYVTFYDDYIRKYVVMGQKGATSKVHQTKQMLKSKGWDLEGQYVVVEFIGKKPKTQSSGDYHDFNVTLANS